jgi:hypothetical protein
MRKIIVLSMITLDGVMQAPGAPEEDTSGDTKATISIAEKLGKLAKLKEQGAITEESLIFYG